MHETHLIEPILKGVTEHAQKENAKSVSKIHLKVGLLLGVQEEPFREAFALLSRGTLLEGAKLELTFFPGTRIEVLSFNVEE